MSAPADHDSLHESSPENVMSRIAEQILRNGDGRNAKKTGRLFISPLARRVARDRGIDLAALEGSGPHGRIVVADVERAASERPIERLPQPMRRSDGPNLDELGVELYERVKRVRREVSDELGIEASYLMTRALMTRIAERRPRTLDELAALNGVEGWQMDLLGNAVVKAVRAFEDDVAAGRLPLKRPRRRRS